MLLMRDAMTVEEVKEFSLVPGWSGDVETVSENVGVIALSATFADGTGDYIGYINIDAFEDPAEAWEYAKNLVCAMFDDGKLDLVSEQIKGYVTAS